MVISCLCVCLETGSHQDDEYAWAGVRDPKIMITTSHSPSSRLKQFAKVITMVLLNRHVQGFHNTLQKWVPMVQNKAVS